MIKRKKSTDQKEIKNAQASIPKSNKCSSFVRSCIECVVNKLGAITSSLSVFRHV